MTYTFYLPKLELRAKEVNGKPTYIVKGYANTVNYPYPYKTTDKGRTFKEYFTPRGIENLKKKAKSEKIFVDAEHILSTKHSSEIILNQIKEKTEVNIDEQIDYLKTRFKYADIPMFKVEDIEIDDKGLFVEVHGNPYYRDVDSDHQKFFDAIWGSLESGFINGMSLNFKPTETVQINNGLTQIDNVDLYGISLTGSPANDMATITEVAMRSIEHEVKECPMKRTLKRLML